MEDLRLVLRLLVALLLAGVLGWERERTRAPAGLRTHMLVGMSTCLIAVLGEIYTERFRGMGQGVVVDPTRVLEAVVGGVSFLGAGTIFVSRGRERVHGLTTAASILATACVGIAAGVEQYLLAGSCTVILFVVLAVLRKLEVRWGTAKPLAGEDGPARRGGGRPHTDA